MRLQEPALNLMALNNTALPVNLYHCSILNSSIIDGRISWASLSLQAAVAGNRLHQTYFSQSLLGILEWFCDAGWFFFGGGAVFCAKYMEKLMPLGFRFCYRAEQMGLHSSVLCRFATCLRSSTSLKSVGVEKLKVCETLLIKCWGFCGLTNDSLSARME